MPISRSLKPSTQRDPVTFSWNDFSGGLNADYANYPLALSENELAEILNYRYVKQGGLVKLRSRDGLTKMNTSVYAAATITNMFCFKGTNCILSNNDAAEFAFGSGAFTKIGDLTSSNGNMWQFNNKLVVANPGAAIFAWDGASAWAALTDAPSATFVISKKNRLYANSGTNKHWLYYCNNNDPNDWTTTGGAGYIIFDGHYAITAAYPYKEYIYIFCEKPKAIYRLSGDTPDEYTVDLMWNDVTAQSFHTIQDVGDDLIFVDTCGVVSIKRLMEYDDVTKAIISKKINRTYIFPNAYQNLYYSGKDMADNLYFLAITSGLATDRNSDVLVYDTDVGEWTIYNFELGSGVTPRCFGLLRDDSHSPSGDGVNTILHIGCSDGNIYYFDFTKSQDNGTDFSLIAKTNWHDLGVLFDKDCRFIDSVVISANQETYDLEIYVNLNTVTPIKTLSLVSLSQNGAYQSPYCGNLNEVNFNFKQIQAKVTAIASGTGPHWLDRIVIEAAVLSHY